MKAFSILALALVIFGHDARACDVFSGKTIDHKTFVGKDFDWSESDGVLKLINVGDTFQTDSRYSWTVKQASLSWSMNSLDSGSAIGGMNDAGLVIEAVWLLETVYPPTVNGLPDLGETQWIQEELSESQSVQQVIDHLPLFSIHKLYQPIHIFLCDPLKCAVIEFLKGVATVTTDANLLVSALTNMRYAQGLSMLKQFQDFGGTRPDTGVSPPERFARETTFLNKNTKAPTLNESSGFALLKNLSVNQGATPTVWTLIYTLEDRKVSVLLKDGTVSAFSLSDLTAQKTASGVVAKIGNGTISAVPDK